MSCLTFANSSRDNLYDHTLSLSDTTVPPGDEEHPSVKGFVDKLSKSRKSGKRETQDQISQFVHKMDRYCTYMSDLEYLQ